MGGDCSWPIAIAIFGLLSHKRQATALLPFTFPYSSRSSFKSRKRKNPCWHKSTGIVLNTMQAWRWNGRRRAPPLVNLACRQTALLSHKRQKTVLLPFTFPCSSRSLFKSPKRKKTCRQSQQGLFRILCKLGDGWRLIMTHRYRDIRPTVALKDGHYVALYLSPAQAGHHHQKP